MIGKEVPGRPGLRYVRKVGQAPIYVVEAKTDKLSTKFEDFIERNLLGINSFDIKRLWIRDYSVDQLRQALVQRGETVIEYNDTGEPKWKLVEDRKFTMNKEKPGEGQWVAVKMPGRRRTQHGQAGRIEDGPGRSEDRRRQPQAGRPERRLEEGGRFHREERSLRVAGARRGSFSPR